ncbi:MAG: DUF3450 family protein [Phycisphaeraceae bacterium]
MTPAPPRFATAGLLLTAALCAAPTAAQDQQAPPPSTGQTIGDTRATIERWLEVRKTIAKEKADWAQARAMMLDRIELLKRDIEKVRAEIEKEREKLAGFETNIEALQAQNDALKRSSDELAEMIAAMERRTLALLDQAPEPLSEAVRPLAVQLTGYRSGKDAQAGPQTGEQTADATAQAGRGPAQDKPASPEVPLSRRVENVTGVLFVFNKFAGKIEQASELVDQPDGTALSVATIYLGLSYGYYVDDAGTTAAVGSAGEGAWTWTPNNDAADVVKTALAVLNKDRTAAFVQLPVEVKQR